MKKTKKLAALVLAMVMALSLMAVTASAYGAEEHVHSGECCAETIQPRIPAMQCPQCGATMEVSKVYYNDAGVRCIDFRCPFDKTPVIGIPW